METSLADRVVRGTAFLDSLFEWKRHARTGECLGGRQLSFPQSERGEEIHLLLDSSASMRGFALAAVRNEQAPAESWVSLFVGVDSLSRHIRLSRFGGGVEAHPGPVVLFPL